MATGGAFLVVMLWLLQDPSLGDDDDMDTQISAPPELVALIPAAAAATVAAGYINSTSEEALTNPVTSSVPNGSVTEIVVIANSSGDSNVVIKKPVEIVETSTEITVSSSEAPSEAVETSLEKLENSLENLGASMLAPTTSNLENSSMAVETPPGPITSGSEYVGAPVEVITVGAIEDSTGIVGTPVEVATVEVITENSQASTPKEEVLMVGDARYEWKEWSQWHCNCPAGSMSRVRDIAYSVPGVHLDPLQYNILRFEREACHYNTCRCDPEAHQCDQLEVTCNEEATHVCALKDLEYDQQQKRKEFWARVHTGLKNLWNNMKDAFPQSKKEPKANKHRRAATSVR